MSKHKSEYYKISAVQYYLTKNKNQLQTCEIFKCHPRSLMRWVDKYNKNKNITRKRKTSKAYKVKKEQVDYILKSRLQKKEGLTYNYLQRNIAIVLRDIQLTTFNNIFIYYNAEIYSSC